MNELNNLIDLALKKAKQDLNNEKIEVHYTPEFLIELLEEIKEVANAKPKGDVYEIRKEWSAQNDRMGYYIYKNNNYIAMSFYPDVAQTKLDQIKSNTMVEVMHREEVANVG